MFTEIILVIRIENKIKMNGKERYNIYSASKPITCVAALQLYEKGLFKLEDKLSLYMPEFENMYILPEGSVEAQDKVKNFEGKYPSKHEYCGLRPAKKDILIKDLFCMRAGFLNYIGMASPAIELCKEETNGRCPTRMAIKYFAKEPLLFEPGEKWEYSMCHDILAALVEEISGMRFGEYVKKNIFDVLGMDNSTFLLDKSELGGICPQYMTVDGKIERCYTDDVLPFCKLGSEYESGGGGCISTVEDYIKFCEALRVGDVILKKETIDLMASNHLTEEQRKSFCFDDYGYGLGVKCPKDEKKSDFGWGGAAGSWPIIDRKNELSAFYVQHVVRSPVQGVRYELTQIVGEILNTNNIL